MVPLLMSVVMVAPATLLMPSVPPDIVPVLEFRSDVMLPLFKMPAPPVVEVAPMIVPLLTIRAIVLLLALTTPLADPLILPLFVSVPTLLPEFVISVGVPVSTPVSVIVISLLFHVIQEMEASVTVVSPLTVVHVARAAVGVKMPSAVTKVKADVLRRRER